jgi:hypothetical protein
VRSIGAGVRVELKFPLNCAGFVQPRKGIPMPRETRRAGSTGVGDARPTVSSVRKGVFRKEGEYWTVGFGGNSFRLKDTRGFGYIAHLLRHPGAESIRYPEEGMASMSTRSCRRFPDRRVRFAEDCFAPSR